MCLCVFTTLKCAVKHDLTCVKNGRTFKGGFRSFHVNAVQNDYYLCLEPTVYASSVMIYEIKSRNHFNKASGGLTSLCPDYTLVCSPQLIRTFRLTWNQIHHRPLSCMMLFVRKFKMFPHLCPYFSSLQNMIFFLLNIFFSFNGMSTKRIQ